MAKPHVTRLPKSYMPPAAASLNKQTGKKIMYAVIVTGGKQYRVSVGDLIFVEKLPVEENTKVEFVDVLLIGGDGKPARIGEPTVPGARVVGKVLRQGKAKKITVFTYRPKKDSKRKLGHRQRYTKIRITEIKE